MTMVKAVVIGLRSIAANLAMSVLLCLASKSHKAQSRRCARAGQKRVGQRVTRHAVFQSRLYALNRCRDGFHAFAIAAIRHGLTAPDTDALSNLDA